LDSSVCLGEAAQNFLAALCQGNSSCNNYTRNKREQGENRRATPVYKLRCRFGVTMHLHSCEFACKSTAAKAERKYYRPACSFLYSAPISGFGTVRRWCWW